MSGRLLAFAGSYRTASFNRKLIEVAAAAARDAGAEVHVLDLRALALPIYDGDLEEREGLPPGAREIKEQIVRAGGLLIATPEYNGSIPGGLKNAIDWASRPPSPLPGKVLGVMGASPSPMGTVRAQLALRQVMGGLGMWVVPTQVLIPHAAAAFDEHGALQDPKQRAQVAKLVAELLREIAS